MVSDSPVLIFGADGQLGRALQASAEGRRLALSAEARCDLRDAFAVSQLVRTVRPAWIVNAAAYTAVDRAESEIGIAYGVNRDGAANLARAALETGSRLIQISTDYVFDGESLRAYHEFDLPNPLSAYARSKLAGETAVRDLSPRHYIVRTAWLYGAGRRNFAQTMLGLADRPEVRVVSDQFGSPTYVPHLAGAIAVLVETGAFGTYHLAGGGGTSWYGLTCALYAAFGISTAIRAVPSAELARPARRPRYSVLTTLQSPSIQLPPWEEGVRELARAVRSAP